MAAISICLLAHQSSDFIGQTIKSVLQQTFADWEMLISDDASTDGTGGIVEPFLTDSRIRYIRHEKNLRQAANWAYAINHTTAPIIATLHADDVWRPNTLELLVAPFALPEMDFVWGNWTRVTPERTPLRHQAEANPAADYLGTEVLTRIFLTNCVLPSAAAIRREVVDAAGLPDSRYGMLCDREWWLRISKYCRRARSISEDLMDYRVHEASVTTEYSRDGRLVQELDLFEAELPAFLASVPDHRTLLSEYQLRMADFHFRTAIGQRLSSDSSQAPNRMRKALLYNPHLLRTPAYLIKWLLFILKGVGRPGLKMLHNRNPWVTSLEKTT